MAIYSVFFFLFWTIVQHHRVASDAAVEDIFDEEEEEEKEWSQINNIASIPEDHPLYGQLQMTDASHPLALSPASKKGLNSVSNDPQSVSKDPQPISNELPSMESMVLWVPGEWSQCSLRCGGSGMKVRKVTCERGFDTHFRVVPDSVCENDAR